MYMLLDWCLKDYVGNWHCCILQCFNAVIKPDRLHHIPMHCCLYNVNKSVSFKLASKMNCLGYGGPWHHHKDLLHARSCVCIFWSMSFTYRVDNRDYTVLKQYPWQHALFGLDLKCRFCNASPVTNHTDWLKLMAQLIHPSLYNNHYARQNPSRLNAAAKGVRPICTPSNDFLHGIIVSLWHTLAAYAKMLQGEKHILNKHSTPESRLGANVGSEASE